MFGEKKQWLEIGYSWLHPSLCLVSSLRLGTNFFLLSLVRDGYNVYHCVVKWWTDNNETAAVWSCFVSETYTHTHTLNAILQVCAVFTIQTIFTLLSLWHPYRVFDVWRVCYIYHIRWILITSLEFGIWKFRIAKCPRNFIKCTYLFSTFIY